MQDVHFRVGKPRIVVNVDRTIPVTDEFCPDDMLERAKHDVKKRSLPNLHDRSTVRRVLAVEDQNRFGNIFLVEQVDSEGILVVEINGPINVAALIFIFESAVDYHSTVISVIIFSIDHVNENAVVDPRETVGLVF
jgi:hypothetical protein